MNSLLEKTIVLVGIYNQQFQGTIFLMVFDFQGHFQTFTAPPSFCFAFSTFLGGQVATVLDVLLVGNPVAPMKKTPSAKNTW